METQEILPITYVLFGGGIVILGLVVAAFFLKRGKRVLLVEKLEAELKASNVRIKDYEQELEARRNLLEVRCKELQNKTLEVEILEGTIRQQAAEPEQLQELLSTSIEFQSSEVARISKELYDSVNTGLSLVTMKLAAAEELQGHLRSDRTRQLFEKTIGHSKAIIRHTMQKLQGLTPEFATPAVEEPGLAKTLGDLCLEISKQFGVSVAFSQDDEFMEPLAGDQQHIYCAVKEALTNTIENGATLASVCIRKQDGKLTISVKDNGVAEIEQTPLFDSIRCGVK